jgi:hypothetical protein
MHGTNVKIHITYFVFIVHMLFSCTCTSILIVLCFTINLEKSLHSYLRMDTELQCKELFDLWLQRKHDHSNIKSEYVQNSVIGMYRYFCLRLRTRISLVDFVYEKHTNIN